MNTDALIYRARPTELMNEKIERRDPCQRAEVIEWKSRVKQLINFKQSLSLEENENYV